MSIPVPQPDRTQPVTRGSHRVVGPRPVFGAEPGELLKVDMPTDAFEALVEAGHLDPSPVVTEESAETETERAEEPVPVGIHYVTDGDNVHAADSNI